MGTPKYNGTLIRVLRKSKLDTFMNIIIKNIDFLFKLEDLNIIRALYRMQDNIESKILIF